MFVPHVIADMHDQSASRISGLTKAVVSAMVVRALRIVVLKSAGDFTRDDDLNAEKIQRVKCFMFTRCGIAIFDHRRDLSGSKISGVQLAEVTACFALRT